MNFEDHDINLIHIKNFHKFMIFNQFNIYGVIFDKMLNFEL